MPTKKATPVATPFDEAYGRLNEAQRKAVDTIEGPVMVIAGPGTGKTQILALRIANILRRTDASPSSILALTFTESGVASMRARLVSLMGQDGYRVGVYTFHGFCNEVIRRYPDRFPSIIGRMPLIELDALAIVRELLDELRPMLLRPHGKPEFYIRDIISKLSEVKREHVTPNMLKERIAQERACIENASDLYHEKGAHAGKIKGAYTQALRSLEKAGEFAGIYERYEQVLAERGHYDFEDTIIAVIEALAQDEDLKLILQEERQYILADEHQDANGSQNELLVLLSDFHPEPNLFIVGDEKQAIYRFQGASLENFFSFKRRYKNAVLIPLSDNYRSTQRILDTAHALIASTQSQAGLEHVSLCAKMAHEEQDIICICARDEDMEHEHIAEEIARYIKRGTLLREIAILVRRNADIPLLAAALEKRDIPYAAQGDDAILTHPTVRGFITLLQAIAHFGDDTMLYPVLTLPYTNISNLDIYLLTTTPLHKPGALYERLSDDAALSALGIRDREACKALYALLDAAVRTVRELPLISAIEQIFSRSGCLAYILGQSDALAALEVMRAFFRYIRALIDAHSTFTLADVLNALAEAKEYRLSIGSTAYRAENAVSIMTVHRAKGMEFDHVFIPHMHDRLWGGRRASERLALPLFSEMPDTDEDDERRLLYVAMTRARKTLTFSYAEMSNDGSPRLMSRYLLELKERHVKEVIAAGGDAPSFAASPKEVSHAALSDEEKVYLRKRLSEQGLSVTALNNYLESPWKYFFINLLRIPQSRAPHLLYGSAIDEALKWYTEERKEREDARGASARLTENVSEQSEGNSPVSGQHRYDETPNTDAVLRVFTEALLRRRLTKRDFETYRARGIAALTGYLLKYADSWHVDSESAVSIIVSFETGMPELPVLTLRGELDKVERLGSGLGDGLVRVVDYKTGKPKTRGEIEGTTKTSNGNLKRQLIFYKLLLDLETTRKWETQETVLDFVEPDIKGNFRRESYVVSPEDTAELAKTLRETLRDIYAFSFWGTHCDEGKWNKDGCALVSAIKNRGKRQEIAEQF